MSLNRPERRSPLPLHWRLRIVLWVLSAAAVAVVAGYGGPMPAIPVAVGLVLFLAGVGEPMLRHVQGLGSRAGDPRRSAVPSPQAVATPAGEPDADPAPGAELARAVAEGQMTVLVRPVRRLSDGVGVGIEAELRWRHPLRGLLPPEAWPEPVPEALGSTLLDLWWRAACAQAARGEPGDLDMAPWPASSAGAVVGVTAATPVTAGMAPVTGPAAAAALSAFLSPPASTGPGGGPVALWLRLGPVWLGMPDLVPRLHQALTDSGLPRESLRLRIAPLRSGRTATLPPIALQLQAQGFLVVADGFGEGRPSSPSAAEAGGPSSGGGLEAADEHAAAGESVVAGSASLAHLGQWPVKAVCLDRSIVERASHSAAPRLVVESTARVAAALGMVTLADGVASATQARDLAQLGCQFGVGEGCGPWLEPADWSRRRQARAAVGST